MSDKVQDNQTSENPVGATEVGSVDLTRSGDNLIDENAGESVTESEEAKEDKVAYSTYKKTLSEKKKLQEEFNRIKAERDEHLRKMKDAEEEKLKEEKRYKELFEERDKELKKIRQQQETERQSFREAKKIEAFLRASGGLRNEVYRQFINTDKIIVTSDGKVDEISLQDYVKDFKENHPELLAQTTTSRKAPVGQEKPSIKSSDWDNLSYEEKKKLSFERGIFK